MKIIKKAGKPLSEIPAPYFDISGVTAVAADVLDTKKIVTATGVLTNGAIPVRGPNNIEITTLMGTVIPAGYYDGTAKAVLSAEESEKVIGGNLKKGVTFLEVPGILETEPPPPLVGDYRVRFLDYDGSIILETRVNNGESVAAPLAPVHNGLIFDGWNYDAAEYANVTYDMDIGAMYSTASGKTELDISLNAVTGLLIDLKLTNQSGTVTVNWGDGSEEDSNATTGSKVFSHTYLTAGSYTITIDSTGTYYFGGTSDTYSIFGQTSTDDRLSAVRLSSKCISLQGYAFSYCASLKTITMPASLTFVGRNKGYAFNECRKLIGLVIPSGVEVLTTYTCASCRSLISISLPLSLIILGGSSGGAFNNCLALESLIIPPNVSSIKGYLVYNCIKLEHISLPQTLISLDPGVFLYCYMLHSLTLPIGLQTIPGSAFDRCYRLSSITLPASIISIGDSAFAACNNLQEIILEPTVPPTMVNINAFNDINNFCKIYVPDESLAAYKIATNWVIYENYIYPISTR